LQQIVGQILQCERGHFHLHETIMQPLWFPFSCLSTRARAASCGMLRDMVSQHPA
jgi:hypothetical protein